MGDGDQDGVSAKHGIEAEQGVNRRQGSSRVPLHGQELLLEEIAKKCSNNRLTAKMLHLQHFPPTHLKWC